MENWYNDVTCDELPEAQQKFLDALSVPQVLSFCEEFGGKTIYIPVNDKVYQNVVRNTAIFVKYKAGINMTAIAAQYGISARTVRKIVKAKQLSNGKGT